MQALPAGQSERAGLLNSHAGSATTIQSNLLAHTYIQDKTTARP